MVERNISWLMERPIVYFFVTFFVSMLQSLAVALGDLYFAATLSALMSILYIGVICLTNVGILTYLKMKTLSKLIAVIYASSLVLLVWSELDVRNNLIWIAALALSYFQIALFFWLWRRTKSKVGSVAAADLKTDMWLVLSIHFFPVLGWIAYGRLKRANLAGNS